MFKKIIYTGFMAGSLVLLGSGITAHADRLLQDPTFTYGETVENDNLKEETANLLGVEQSEDLEEVLVYVNELNDLLNDNYPYQVAYSSTYITPSNNEGNVTVEIATPETITSITESQYRNAAITAGAVDVHITVASAVAVDGSGALAGVYKAFGDELNERNIEVAQQELATLSEINRNNTNNPEFSQEAFDAATAEAKQEVQLQKSENENLTAEDIERIVNDVLEKYELRNALSDQEISQYQDLFLNIGELNFSQDQITNIRNFGQNLVEDASEALSGIDLSNLGGERVESGGNWFTNIINSIVAFFSNLFSRFTSDNSVEEETEQPADETSSEQQEEVEQDKEPQTKTEGTQELESEPQPQEDTVGGVEQEPETGDETSEDDQDHSTRQDSENQAEEENSINDSEEEAQDNEN